MRIGLIGKYVQLPDAYLSVVESLKHAGFHHGAAVEIDWIQAEEVEGLLADGRLADLDGMVIPGGFGARGIEGKIAAARYAREQLLPCLGLCLGLQTMTIEFARNVVGLTGANSTEFDPTTQHPVIDLMHDQRDVTDKGGTMRLGAYYAVLEPGTKVAAAYGEPVVSERHRHRYEFNSNYRGRLAEHGFVCSGTSPDRRLVEFIELADHPFWVGTQAHPEFKSRPDHPHPLFRDLVGAALTFRAQRAKPLRRWRADGGGGRLPPRRGPARPRRLRVGPRPSAASRLPTASRSSARSCAPRARWAWCRCSTATTAASRPWCWSPSTGRRSTGCSSRRRPGCATSRANRPRRRHGASWPRRSASPPARSTPLFDIIASPGMTDQVLWLFLATDCRPSVREAHGVEEEHSEVIELPLSEALAWMADGRIQDAKSVIGLLLVDQRRRAATRG